MMHLVSTRELKDFDEDPSKKAYITERLYMKPYKEKYFISDDSFWSTSQEFYFSKNFCCPDYLNTVIHQLFAAGLIQKIDEDELFFTHLKNSPSDSSEPNNPRALYLEDIKGAFTILIFDYTLSIIALVVEIAIKYYFPELHKSIIKKRRRKLMKMQLKTKTKTNCANTMQRQFSRPRHIRIHKFVNRQRAN